MVSAGIRQFGGAGALLGPGTARRRQSSDRRRPGSAYRTGSVRCVEMSSTRWPSEWRGTDRPSGLSVNQLMRVCQTDESFVNSLASASGARVLSDFCHRLSVIFAGWLARINVDF